MGDYGDPYGNEEKGWRKNPWQFLPQVYVANTTALLKFPLRDLDVVISDEKSYPSVD